MIIPTPCYSPIINRSVFARQRYTLIKDWIITLADGTQLVFPAWFVTDLASIPRPLWSIPGFSPTGPLMYGSIPHDFGYQYGYLLTPYVDGVPYPEESRRLWEQYPELFGQRVPIFMGQNQRFFDDLLASITIEATGRVFVATVAELVLRPCGKIPWSRYRTVGPSAYNQNSLGLPGITTNGYLF